MRVDGSFGTIPPARDMMSRTAAAPAPEMPRADQTQARPAMQRFSVLNDFRYLTDADKDLLRHSTGEQVEPSLVDNPGSASPFAQQLALDRRTGALAPGQIVTSVFLRNRAQEIDARNYGRPNLRNPYAGEGLTKAFAYLDAVGQSRADLRL